MKRVLLVLGNAAVGAFLTQSLLGGLILIGWTMRASRRAALALWWERSPHSSHAPTLGDWLQAHDRDNPDASWPNWFLSQSGVAAQRGQEIESRSGTWRRLARVPFHSFFLNLKLGIQSLFNTWVLTMPGCVLMLFSWYDGWNNSFNKGYEQAPVGPLTGVLGILLFIIAMLYVPLAQARQAVTGRWQAFYDFQFVWGLARRRCVSNLLLALGYTMLWLPLGILKTAPYFFAHNNRTVENYAPEQALAFLNSYFLACGLAAFAAFILLRLWVARLYAAALVSGLHKDLVPLEALDEFERSSLARLDMIQVTPTRSRHLFLRIVAKTGKGIWNIGVLFATGFIWFTFIAQVYVSEFLHYHPVTAWLNQPLIQLPWFRYVPANLNSPLPELFLTLLFLAAVFSIGELLKKVRRLGAMRN